MTRRLTVASAIRIHDTLVCQAPVLDEGKLDGALASPLQSLMGSDAYPTMAEKAAKMLESVSRAHAFLDGNKRTAWLCCVTFLGINGVEVVNLQQLHLAEVVEGIAEAKYEVPAIAKWMNGIMAISPASDYPIGL